MATEAPLIHDGAQCTAAADLSTKQFYAVQISASRAVNLSLTGGLVYGILQNKPKAAQVADVGILGISKAAIGLAVSTAGWPLMTNTLGQLIPQTGTNHVCAYSIETGTGTTTVPAIITVSLIGPNVDIIQTA
jgi:hypothetical protein